MDMFSYRETNRTTVNDEENQMVTRNELHLLILCSTFHCRRVEIKHLAWGTEIEEM